jgi:primosomal protein N' (replication factor Y)
LFDEDLLSVMRAMARRFIAPLPSFLRLLTPARLGKGVPPGATQSGELTAGAAARHLWRPAPGEDPLAFYVQLVKETLATDRGALVMVPEVTEGSRILEHLRIEFGSEAALVGSDQDPKERSIALWSVAAGQKRLVLGSRAAAFAPAFPLGLIIVHSEHDRSFKEQRAPYYDAREVALARAATSGAELYFVDSTPSLGTMGRVHEGWRIKEADREIERRAWPTVELLEPPRTGMARRAIAAIIEACNRRERTLVLLPRVRTTPAGPGPERVAEFIRRVVPSATVSRADREALSARGALSDALNSDVVVATEAALAEIERPSISTAVAVDADVLLHRPSGRSSEEGFQILWSLATLVAGRNPRGHLLIETRSPEHHTVQALTRGDFHYFAKRELEGRIQSRSPPFVALVVLRGAELGDEMIGSLRQLTGVELLGPARAPRGMEVLLKVDDLEASLDPLREIVSSTPGILVEVDPRDW